MTGKDLATILCNTHNHIELLKFSTFSSNPALCQTRMEQYQEAISKSTHFRSCGSKTFEINRMSGHTDKIPDKIVRTSNQDKASERKLKQDHRHANVLSSIQESRYPFRQSEDKMQNGKRKGIMSSHSQDPVAVNKKEIQEQTRKPHVTADQSERPCSRGAQEEVMNRNRNSGDDAVKQVNEKPDSQLDGERTQQQQKEQQRHHHHVEGHNQSVKWNDSTELQIGEVGKSDEMILQDNIGINKQESTDSGLASSSQTYDNIEDFDNNLPSTVMLLRTKGGSKVYVVGTVHFSLESQKDVANLIAAVRPNHLVLELCPSRAYMLNLNEEQILKEAQNLNFTMMRNMIRSAGVVQGGLHLLFLSMTIKITKQLGIAPGGEFRTAFREAVTDPNCMITFGDRPIHVTLHRMLASLSCWKITKLLFEVLFKGEKITMEEVEKCKNRDVLERMILGLSKELPELARVMVDERDQYLSYSLQVAAQSGEPNRVVGVVGIGHMAGIKENWGKVTVETIQEILSLPPPSRKSKIFKFTLKFTAVGLVLYGIHKIASRSEFYSNLFSSYMNWGWLDMMYDAVDMHIIEA